MAWKSKYEKTSTRITLSTMAEEYDCLYKVIIVGDSGVGKTSLLLRFVEDRYTEDYDFTVGVDFKTKIVEIKGKKVKLYVWDTSGQERFRAITASYYRDAQGVVLVYDVTNPRSFESINQWLQEAEANTDDNIAKVLVGNKSDLSKKREIGGSLGKEKSEELGIKFLETSTKDSFNIDNVFLTLVNEIETRIAAQKRNKNNGQFGKSKQNTNIRKQNRDGRKSCC